MSPATGLRIVAAGGFKALADRLERDTAAPFDPFTPETVVVQSRAVERELRQGLARSRGVCANMEFPFPGALAFRLFRLVSPDMPSGDPFSRQAMALRVFGLLPDMVRAPEFKAVRRFLEGADDSQRMHLAEHMAQSLESCLFYLPEMVRGWERGEIGDAPHEPWQASLWLAMSAGNSGHRACLAEKFADAMNRGPCPEGLPPRLSLFAVGHLPPFYMDILAALSLRVPVTAYVPSPAWTGEPGNALAASMGAATSGFIRAMEERGAEVERLPETGPAHGLLGRVQTAIRTNRPLEVKADEIGSDDSIRVHVCHGPMREVEVLRDRLLELFDAHPSLRPEDVVVMAPDMAAYAPYVDAVFQGRDHVPHSLAERPESETPSASAFLALLDTGRSRFAVSSVLSLLEIPAVAERFGLAAEDSATARDWIDRAAIRWGLDGAHRQALGQPPFEENTWRLGLSRLLLGFAMPGDGVTDFMGVLPLDAAEGGAASTLGAMCGFLGELSRLAEELAGTRSLDQWRVLFHDVLNRFFAQGPEWIEDIERIASAVAGMDAGVAPPPEMDARTARLLVSRDLEKRPAPERRRGVAFGCLAGLGHIPAKVVCLLGMDSEVFPRQENWPGFDLASASGRPAPGRSPGDQDRQSFLAALLAPEHVLHVSYQGLSIRDNAEAPPSVAVSELLDALADAAPGLDDAAIRSKLVFKHHLQAFHPDNFAPDAPLAGFSRDDLEGARGLLSPRPARPFLSRGLPRTEKAGDLSLDRLKRFFRGPAAFLAEERLKLRLGDRIPAMEDDEPLTGPPGMDGYLIKTRLLEAFLGKCDPEAAMRAELASGTLPPGEAGRVVLEKLASECEGLAARVAEAVDGRAPLAPLDARAALPGRDLEGRLADLWPHARIRFRPAKIKPKDRLDAWLDHLLLCASGNARPTLFLAGNADMVLEPVDGSVDVLADLAGLMDQGLEQALPFFPAASWAYAALAGEDEARALREARVQWEGDPHKNISPESGEPACALFFPDAPLELPEFADLAGRIYAPLLGAMEESEP